MTEPMSAIVELWPLAADEAGIWLISGTGPWTGGQIPADSEPHFEAEQIAAEHDPIVQFAVLHSTSWRVDGEGHVILTFVGIAEAGDYIRARWPLAMPVTPQLAAQVGKPITHAAGAPPVPRDIDVLMHALRHVRFLRDTDESARTAMTPAWLRHLAAFDPALSGLYTDRHIA